MCKCSIQVENIEKKSEFFFDIFDIFSISRYFPSLICLLSDDGIKQTLCNAVWKLLTASMSKLQFSCDSMSNSTMVKLIR